MSKSLLIGWWLILWSIFSKEPGWLTPGGEGQLKDRYFLEDLFYPHKSDRNNTSRARARTLTYQLTLYFRGNSYDSFVWLIYWSIIQDTTGHDRLRKLELWFRKDDKEKRNEWAHKIQDVRLRIDQLNKQLIRDNQSNLVVRILWLIWLIYDSYMTHIL